MAFREDEEARRLRRQALEARLAETRRGLEQLATDAEERQSKERALEALRAEIEQELASLEGGDSRPTPVATPAEALPGPARTRPLVEWLRELPGRLGLVIMALVVLAGPAYGGYACIDSIFGPFRLFDHTIDLEWPAHVVQSRGINLPAGTRCTIDAQFARSGEAVGGGSLAVRCAGRELFAGDFGYEGCHLRQEAAARGFRYAFGCGTAVTTDAVSFSHGEPGKAILVSGDPEGAFRVELSVVEPVASAEDFYERPPPPTKRFAEALRRGGVVSRVGGASPVARGVACRISIEPVPVVASANCRVIVECGGHVLRRARTACTVEGGSPVGAEVEGLDLDVPSGRVRIEESGPGLPYQAEIRLLPDP